MSKKNPTIKQITIDEITAAAQHLPETMAMVKTETMISGHDLLLLNKKTVGGQPIEPNQVYAVKMPQWRKVNHKDEMIKIYTESIRIMSHEQAYQQVCAYITKIKAKNQPQSNGNKKSRKRESV